MNDELRRLLNDPHAWLFIGVMAASFLFSLVDLFFYFRAKRKKQEELEFPKDKFKDSEK